MADNNPHLNGDQYSVKLQIPYQESKENLLSTICAGLLLLLFGVAVITFVFCFQNNGECHATNALLTEFSYDEDNHMLYYNRALNVTICNLNTRAVIHYEHVEAKALYENVLLAYSNNNNDDNISPFDILVNTSHYLSTQFKGRRLILLHPDQTLEYHKHKSLGIYDIPVKLFLIDSGLGRNQNTDCSLKVPLTMASSTN